MVVHKKRDGPLRGFGRGAALPRIDADLVLISISVLRHGTHHAHALTPRRPGPRRWRVSHVQQGLRQYLRSCRPIDDGAEQGQPPCRLQLLPRRHRHAVCLVGVARPPTTV